MNPFSSLITQLPSRPTRRDQVIEATYTVTRTYRPMGKALTMIRALRTHGPMTSSALAAAAGVSAKQVPSLLAKALKTGLVDQVECDTPVKWEAPQHAR